MLGLKVAVVVRGANDTDLVEQKEGTEVLCGLRDFETWILNGSRCDLVYVE